MVYDNLGTLSVFFGRKMTIDNLIPLSNSCFNKKDFMLRVSLVKLNLLDGMLERNTLLRLKSRAVNFSQVFIGDMHTFAL